MAENHAEVKPIKTVRDMMVRLEEEIAQAKNGTLPLETARVVLKGRDLQIKAAQLNIQHARLQRHQQKRGKATDRNLLTGEEIIEIEPGQDAAKDGTDKT